MPISDKLDEAIALAKAPKARPCPVTRLLDSGQLEVLDSKKLQDVIETPIGVPGRLKNTDIIAILRTIRDEKWTFPASAELEYTVPQGSNAVVEVARCRGYAAMALAT